MDAIRTEALTRSFADLKAVDGLGIAVAPGEIFALVGPDGAGKTTTLRMLAAILDPTSGDAWVAGRHVVREAVGVQEAIGYMSQRFGLYPDLTVQENIDFFADIQCVSRKVRRERGAVLLEMAGLGPFQRRMAGNLSGGMKQKLGLVCALIHGPRVLLLDEPTNGVDPVSRRDFWRILYGLLREGVAVLVSTSYLDEAERASRIALIHEGRCISQGTPEEVRRRSGASVLEIRTDRPREAAAQLRDHLPGAIASLFGRSVHLAGPSAGEDGPRVRALLVACGIQVQDVREIEPSLEDVFISAVTAAGGGRRAGH